MDGVLDFSIGLTEGVAWPWPIAVYLFLAGISGGSLGVILTMMKLRGLSGDEPLLKASASIALATILLGMLCLVLDLTDPLFFWRILVFYNPTSVMSVGVMMLLFYIPLTAVLTVIVLRHSLKWLPFGLGSLVEKLGDIFNKARGPITWIVLFLAFGICAYTGFLISALIRYPLINTAVLPALFVASGVSAGTAAAKLLATAVFGEKRDSHTMHILHLAEWPMMAAEISCIFMIAMAMIFGMAGAQAAVTAFTTGVLGGRCGCWLRRAVCARHDGLHSFGCRLLDRRICSSCRHDVPSPLHPLRRPAQLSDAYPGISFFLLNLLKLSMACSVRNACFLSIDTSGQKEALERINASLRDLCRR